MPSINYCKCNKCDFSTTKSAGGYMYVLDEAGNEIVCGHPGEYHTISKVLSISANDAFDWMQRNDKKLSPEIKKKIEDNTGMNFQYICMDCFAETYTHKDKGEPTCKNCNSTEMKYVGDLVDKTCPKCKEGTVEIINAGMS